ncbi:MAG: peptide chain release factor 2 [SAR202 cluster bacterium]|nr:peptide chain release factor 2 [SAR202 cluster bacterium]MQG72081.1 peptide chain release factor 2 [SAR202 cluster bacterium]
MEQLRQHLSTLNEKIMSVVERLDLAGKEDAINVMEREAAEPGYWDDHQTAQRNMQQLGRLRDTVTLWRDLESRSHNLVELTELALAENDPPLQAQLESEGEELTQALAREEINLTLSGTYDDRSAIVTIIAGAGGTDAQDWAEMLMSMYVQWAEAGKRPCDVMDLSYGEEAGLRGATLEIGGPHAFGYLIAEQGVHRLVRLSPYDPNNLRQTSFARVDILPTSEDDPEVEIRSEDIKMDTFRSSGPGGQNVQKVASAVRLTHVPTGIVVSCQNERSQHQNREYAIRILKARLLARQAEEKAKEVEGMRGERKAAEWGSQIRSYVLHPYKSVKDHRTNLQSTNPDAVLAGDIDRFIEAFLMSKVGK